MVLYRCYCNVFALDESIADNHPLSLWIQRVLQRRGLDSQLANAGIEEVVDEVKALTFQNIFNCPHGS